MPYSEPDLTRIEVLDMLRILDEDEKQCVIFRLYSKMPYKEIAEMMNITIASAQKKYQRALKKLKNYNS
ncbi:MAG: hypothetical protein GX815_11655 [Clostridiales bacterium]|nr:hypothetical protein [Clostridiales bacterium]